MKNWEGDVEKPVVSICSITYNHERYIEEAIDSFLMQETNFPFEILIDEDFSTDNTAKKIKPYIEKYPQIIKANLRKKNIGAMANFLASMKRAQGKYIALCEGDDYWTDTNKLQKQVDFLEKNLDYGLVCTDMVKYIQKDKTFIDSNIIPLGQSYPTTMTAKGYVYEELMIGKSQIWTLTVCFRNSLLDDMPILDSAKVFTGDALLYMHIALKSKIKYFQDKTAVYRVLEESASHSKDPVKSLRFLYQIANLLLYFLEKHPINPQLHQIVFYRSMFNRFRFALASENYDVFKTVRLELPSNLYIKIAGLKISYSEIAALKILYLLCKWKPFFEILSRLYKKRIYAPYVVVKKQDSQLEKMSS